MRLCFDATRFGTGLQEAVSLAAEKNISACEFAFDGFDLSAKGAKSLSKAEKEFLHDLDEEAKKKGVEIKCLRLRSVLQVSNEDSRRDFKGQIEKLAKVAEALSCKQVIFYLLAEPQENWIAQVEKTLKPIIAGLQKNEIRLLLSLSTPQIMQGKSLSKWRPIEPQEWRDLLAGIPDLALSYSVADSAWQGIDYLKMLPALVPAIEHVEAQDVQVNRQIISENGYFGPLFWRYLTVGKGQVDWAQFVEALKLYDYKGDISIHFNDEFASENEQGLMEALEASIKVLAPLLKY